MAQRRPRTHRPVELLPCVALRPAAGQGEALHTLVLPDEAVSVQVPTTVLWGEGDLALLPGLLDGLERWVPRLQVQRVADAGHWIVHEQPARVAGLVRALLT